MTATETAPRQTLIRKRGFAVLSAIAAIGVFGVGIIAPLSSPSIASAEVVPLAVGEKMNQDLMAAASEDISVYLEIPTAEKIPEPVVEVESEATDTAASAPAAGNPDPGSAQAIALGYVGEGAEFDCLVALWNKESGWNAFAHNASSGAYGIPQALPGSKMASAGDDWATNPDTQIRWGLGYIQGRYGSPCNAWAHSESVGWY